MLLLVEYVFQVVLVLLVEYVFQVLFSEIVTVKNIQMFSIKF